MTRKDSERAIANLIASTRTKTRSVSLVEFHNWLVKAISALGGVESVADRIGLYPRMLKQFLVINKLEPSILQHVETRALDSIDALNYLARFSYEDQRSLLPLLLTGHLSSKDLRSVYQQRSVLPHASIQQLLKRVSAGKDKRVYELQFVIKAGLTKRQIESRIRAITKRDGLESLALDGPVGKVILSKEGLQRLRAYGRENGIPFRSILSHLLYVR